MRNAIPIFGFLVASVALCEDGGQVQHTDRFVRVHSTVPVIAGQITQIYVREVSRAQSGGHETGIADPVVLFIHGAGTPAEVAFDTSYQDYSWMKFLADAGFDVFAMDMTGYGRSTRPNPMNDPCNLSPEQQKAFVPALISVPCSPSYPRQLTTLASDWNDIATVVDHLKALRHVERVNLIAWSLGGPRSAGYAAHHPENVGKLVLLAPAYNRSSRAEPPAEVPATGAAMTTHSREEFTANWDRQTGCPAQYDPAASEAVWSQMVDSDPVGATWGHGVRRAPTVTSWGWTTAVVGSTQIPTLMVTGAHDKQVPPDRVRDLYADIGSQQKVFIDLACSSHNAMWEKNHLVLFKASLEWLTKGSVNGTHQGMLKLGY
jgi:pimeloyl-ACP methyl ester carboxylesterase